jgi:hypothetical protein
VKRILPFLILALLGASVAAQDSSQGYNSLFDVSEARIFTPGKILVQGEVQDPGTVDLSQLPIHSAPVKELALENGKQSFKGAFFVRGYALCDILNSKKAKKAPESAFSPLVDMYAVVENNKGEKAVFSWGEIFYRNSFNILITRSVQAINPARAKTTWSLPEDPRLICADDLLNARFVSNPTRITVKSYHGRIASEKPKDIGSPEIRIVTKAGSSVIRDMNASIEKRRYDSVLYGHGMGFKEVLGFTGYLLKNLIAANAQITPLDLREGITIVSAKDGYRSVFSLSEIMNRNDNQDFLLNDLKDAANGGRYTLIVPDFFADRNVKSVERIELANVD